MKQQESTQETPHSWVGGSLMNAVLEKNKCYPEYVSFPLSPCCGPRGEQGASLLEEVIIPSSIFLLMKHRIPREKEMARRAHGLCVQSRSPRTGSVLTSQGCQDPVSIRQPEGLAVATHTLGCAWTLSSISLSGTIGMNLMSMRVDCAAV